ncbi:hypothetical protein [Kribbella sp. NPDC048928]|uniref:hypothetical protein n=1 Tax=Kribbella sp. NPDC048928 TaxID=3364111 RepID=UPI0037236333
MPLVDLDDPEELRARWSALAAVAHATGFDRRWYADADGYHHQDESASILRMARLEDGRAVLWGFHTQHSQTAGEDLLAGSPDWIGQPEVRQRQSAGELGFVYGAFNSTWARASYPGDPWQPVDDGFAPIGQWITSDEATADEMVEWVAEWADYLGGLDELRPYGIQLIRSAAGPGITAEALGAFFAPFGIDPRSPLQPDITEGVAAAEDFTRNFAEPASFVTDPDTAEVSVVEAPVIGDNPPPEDEASYVVPPGISPFTGQPITAPHPTTPTTAPTAGPGAGAGAGVGPGGAGAGAGAGAGGVGAAAGGGVGAGADADGGAGHAEIMGLPFERPSDHADTPRKQGWLRRRKHDAAPDPDPEPTPPSRDLAAPGTYLPDDTPSAWLPTRAPDPHPAAAPNPSTQDEPHLDRANLHQANSGSAHPDQAHPGSAAQQSSAGAYSAGFQHPAYDPRLPSAEPPRVGGGVYEGDDFYNSLFADAPAPAATTPDQDWETAEQQSWADQEATSEYNPFATGTTAPGSTAPGSTDTADTAGAPAPAAEEDWNGPAWINGEWVEHPPATPSNQSPASPADAAPADSPFAPPPSASSPFAPPPSAREAGADSQYVADADLEDDDAPTAEIAAVLDPTPPDEEEPASFTGPSPFAPVTAPEPHQPHPAHPDQAHPDPTRSEVTQPEPVHPDPTGLEAAQPELAHPNPTRHEDAAQGEQVGYEPAQGEQVRYQWARSEQAGPGVEEFWAAPQEVDQQAGGLGYAVVDEDDQTAEIPAVVDDLSEAQPSGVRDDYEAEAQVEPHPEPQPWPQPQPEPWPQPEPHPAPWPQPTPPTPEPDPSPFPGRPEPTPGPVPTPEPTPAPSPLPDPFPEPTPDPVPSPEPFPEPTPHPVPDPEPAPAPEPLPDPEPQPHPEPEPEPLPAPEPQPAPDPDQLPTPEPTTPTAAPHYGYAAESRSEYVGEGEQLEGGWEMVPGLPGRSDALLGVRGGDADGFDGDPDDEVPTGFVPVVEDDEPTGVIEAVGYDVAPEDAPHLPDDAELGAGEEFPAHEVFGGAGVGAVAGMVGLGLVGAGEPRVVPEAGSIEEAMRSEVERPRPRPEESDAEQALRDWCRARTKIVPSGFTIQVQVLDPNAPSYRFDLEPPEVDDPEYATGKLSELLGDLWLTEAQSDPGGWLFARIDAAGRTVRIDRWYDQVPDWWDNPVEERLDVNGLVRRLYSRGPQWQPTYLEKLYTSAR